MVTTVIQIRSIAEPVTGKRHEFEVESESIPSIQAAEIWANILAAEQSANDGCPYYVSSVIVDSNNFVMNPSPEYWYNLFKFGVEKTVEIGGETPSSEITCRKKSMSC